MVLTHLKPRRDCLELGKYKNASTHETPGWIIHTKGVLLEVGA